MENHNNKFSIYYGGISKLIPDDNIELSQILPLLNNPIIKSTIEKIRSCDEKKDKHNLKKTLTYITPAGIFKSRKKDDIIKQSGYAPIDIDDLTNVEELKNILKKDPYIELMFTSPSGNGLKLLIKIPEDIKEYPRRVTSFYEYLKKTYDIPDKCLDISTHDISRACYLSYDPLYYYNKKSKVFNLIGPEITIGKEKDPSQSGVEYREIIKLLYIGKSKSYIYKHLDKFDKWKTSSESYREHTYNKAVSYVDDNKPNNNYKDELIQNITTEILNTFTIYTVKSDKYPEMYIYRDGIYVPNAKCDLYEYIAKCLGKYYNKVYGDKIIEKIMPLTYIDADEFFDEEDTQFICVQNGILNIYTKELIEFDPKYKFFNKLPVKFDPDIDCKITKDHFKLILSQNDQELIQEIYGFFLLRSYDWQRSFMFSGEGSNGKSKTLDQIQALLGTYNCANISLETLENKHFMKGYLHKKLANVADDIGNAQLKETRTFKELTGANIITADRKNRDPVTFTNYAKMIFSANKIPLITDDSDGFWRRWIIIRFDVQFLEKTQYDQKKENGTLLPRHRLAHQNMSDLLTTDEELSGVLNWAIDGFHRLLEQGGFSYLHSFEETKELMKRYASPTIRFCQDCTEKVESLDQYEILDDLYIHYVKFCLSRKKPLTPDPKAQFKKIIENETAYYGDRKRTANGWEWRLNSCKFTGIPEDQ